MSHHHLIIINHPANGKSYTAPGSDMDMIVTALGAYSPTPAWLTPSMSWIEYGAPPSPVVSGGSGDQITFSNADLSSVWDGFETDLTVIIAALNAFGGTAYAALANSLSAIT